VSYQERVQAITDAIRSVPDTGVVHDRQRFSADLGEYIAQYRDPETQRINGWEVTRKGGALLDPNSTRWGDVYCLLHFFGLQDAAATDHLFQQGVDDVVAHFRDNPNLPVGSVQGLVRILVAELRVFGGVLCHVAECELVLDFYTNQL
jgi:hypothetical protein